MKVTTEEILKAYQELSIEQQWAVLRITEVFLELNKKTQKKA